MCTKLTDAIPELEVSEFEESLKEWNKSLGSLIKSLENSRNVAADHEMFQSVLPEEITNPIDEDLILSLKSQLGNLQSSTVASDDLCLRSSSPTPKDSYPVFLSLKYHFNIQFQPNRV